jgi:hypothetical protein
MQLVERKEEPPSSYRVFYCFITIVIVNRAVLQVQNVAAITELEAEIVMIETAIVKEETEMVEIVETEIVIVMIDMNPNIEGTKYILLDCFYLLSRGKTEATTRLGKGLLVLTGINTWNVRNLFSLTLKHWNS